MLILNGCVTILEKYRVKNVNKPLKIAEMLAVSLKITEPGPHFTRVVKEFQYQMIELYFLITFLTV